ncbi:hypothetical protein CH286_25205 [Rhodococcus sp. WWJCD1]|uniref:hypothetical protein n=1 Tax=unclassified Rhodococcus (in: high G+C Gram-positive bacteria) TaxID=192944 RepID=UPI000B9C1914|nr:MULTISPECIES: hypothetical protein [unclassified Rhodococcus (in: high G+C Gram-positive bacteria)]OZC42471.1 hypothetical protein CH286_25205 [Rhodococcus sp. WWJCD1]OZE89303.1 hypothetical protein CH302_28400 [Rhodococcus sp. 15-2388-1-1a]
MTTDHQFPPQTREGRHRLPRPPQRSAATEGDSAVKPAFQLDGGDLGAVLEFEAVLWNEPMTGVLREIHITPGRVRVVVLQTEQQKGLYPRYTSSGDPDAPYLVDYDIDFGDAVRIVDRH